MTFRVAVTMGACALFLGRIYAPRTTRTGCVSSRSRSPTAGRSLLRMPRTRRTRRRIAAGFLLRDLARRSWVPYLVAGQPDDSLLLAAVSYTGTKNCKCHRRSPFRRRKSVSCASGLPAASRTRTRTANRSRRRRRSTWSGVANSGPFKCHEPFRRPPSKIRNGAKRRSIILCWPNWRIAAEAGRRSRPGHMATASHVGPDRFAAVARRS